MKGKLFMIIEHSFLLNIEQQSFQRVWEAIQKHDFISGKKLVNIFYNIKEGLVECDIEYSENQIVNNTPDQEQLKVTVSHRMDKATLAKNILIALLRYETLQKWSKDTTGILYDCDIYQDLMGNHFFFIPRKIVTNKNLTLIATIKYGRIDLRYN